jgi:hypothetical protein
VVEAKSRLCPGSDSDYFQNTNLKHIKAHQPSLCTDLGQINLATPFVLHHYGVSDVSVTEYGEMKRMNCKGSGRGLFSN